MTFAEATATIDTIMADYKTAILSAKEQFEKRVDALYPDVDKLPPNEKKAAMLYLVESVKEAAREFDA